jgi:hypothetical protein
MPIRVQVVFDNATGCTIAQDTPGKTAAMVEDLMWRNPGRITGIHVVPGKLHVGEAIEAAKMRAYFRTIDLDVRLNQVMDRRGMEQFDIYEIAKHPRRRVE